MDKLIINNIIYKANDEGLIESNNIKINSGVIGVVWDSFEFSDILLDILATKMPIEEGCISLNGHDYNRDVLNIRSRLTYIKSKGYLYESLTGREYLDIVYRLKIGRRINFDNNIYSYVGELGLCGVLDYKIKTYSDEMVKAIQILEHIITNGDILILEDGYNGINNSVINIIKDFKSIVFMPISLEECSEFEDDIMIINSSKISYLGSRERFINIHKNKGYRQFCSKQQYKYLEKNSKIISYINRGSDVEVIYISNMPLLDSSEHGKIEFKEAYLIHTNLE
ncbi:MAG: hypothetical protein RR840_07205 [Clostridium sp.]